ncbi:putative serine/threonine protein kinase [Aspergillus ruber CBS 135680]|uniref:non-specific serine/threonine protein kinase n=1 Tax=Aspergillus ruber (strain CBS 135680) TaxID=1388766 RepID=A0A017SKQ6_ASPRC|nr:kinase-like protein [Aspergillus ruber CBS 135680]EYE96905.1 kinase-like protein [Aspergillus ruber CBS 135680]
MADRASFLDPTSAVAAITKHKAEAIKLAREQGTAVQEMCRRAKTENPPYEFEELIGKGAYGRVYKGRQLPSKKVVAVKVMDVDSLDYKTVRDFRDESIKDFIHETRVMKQVKDSGARNINELIEAVSIHSQLWLVCEYCPGGSVRTLMRATGDRLDEKFIIPVARELAIGLRAIHDAGIIHRDIKAANILIHEEGRLQICDFGVAGILQSQVDKRSTWIGTPHWMPPEMFSAKAEAHRYGSEIDVWAYGCTLFEFATGNPPNSNLRERMQIGRQLNRTKPRLDKEEYSEELKDLINYALDSDPRTRPTMADTLTHPFITDTEESHPTSSLSELVRVYYQWSQRGGQRISLFHPGGAAAAEIPDVDDTFAEDWNFSTTDGFERRFSVIDLDELAASLAEIEDQISPTTVQPKKDSLDEPRDTDLSGDDKANFDERVRRGATAMEGLFDNEKPTYTYETKNDFVPVEQRRPPSDLPLRTDTDRSSVMSTFIDIDIGSFDSSHYAAAAATAQPIQLADADTIKAYRQQRTSSGTSSRSSSSRRDSEEMTFQPQTGPRPPTMDWKFPVFMKAPEEEAESKLEGEGQGETTPEAKPAEPSNPSDKRATMEWTFPSMAAQPAADGPSLDPGRFETLKAPLVDMGTEPSETIRPISIGEPGDSRPSTSGSQGSVFSFAPSSEADYDPFRLDRPTSPTSQYPHQQYHHGPSGFDTTDFPEIIDADAASYDRPSSVIEEGPGPDDHNRPSSVIEEGPGPDDYNRPSSVIEEGPGPDDRPSSIIEEGPGPDDHDEPNRASSIIDLDGPGPDEEDETETETITTTWGSRTIGPPSRTSFHSRTHRTSNPTSDPFSEPFPTAIPSREYPDHAPDSPLADALPTATLRRRHAGSGGVDGVQFPDLVPPSVESLAQGAEEGVLMGELDRLLGDFLDALSATGEALGKTRPGSGGGRGLETVEVGVGGGGGGGSEGE